MALKDSSQALMVPESLIPSLWEVARTQYATKSPCGIARCAGWGLSDPPMCLH
jgi:hypothetical protein